MSGPALDDLTTISWTRTVAILPTFSLNSWVNVGSLFPAFFPIIFIYVVLIREKDMAPTFRFTVWYITTGCVISALPTFLLCAYCLIAIYTEHREGVLVDYKSVFFLVSAIDRLYVILRHRVMPRFYFVIFQLIFTIPFIVVWCWNMLSGLVESGDICGPTLGSRIPFLSAFIVLLSWIYFICSTGLYLLLYRLFQKNRKQLQGSSNVSTASGQKSTSKSQMKAESKLIVSLLCQAFLPTILSTPYIIALIFYHTGNEKLLSDFVYQAANAIGYAAYTLMPLAFVVFVREFQIAARKILGMRVDHLMTVSVAAASTAPRRSTQVTVATINPTLKN